MNNLSDEQHDRLLDLPLDRFESLLNKSTELLIKRYSDLDSAPPFCGKTPIEIEQMFDEPLPESGMEIESLLETVDEKILQTATLNTGPNYFSYILAPGTQVSLMGELLQASINQNVTKWHLGPAAAEVEKRVVQWGSQYMGFSDSGVGVLVSGGSAANLTGLNVARNMMFEHENVRKRGLSGIAPPVVYTSTEIHGCFDKAVEELGIGSDHLRKIPIDEDCRMRIDLLESQINEDLNKGLRPFCVVGNAGSVNTGAIDPLDKIADLADRYNLWFHIDGAYGSLANSVPSLREQFKGLNRADSIAVDFHKWLYQPVEAGCCLFKDWDQLRRSYQHKAAYLDTDRKDDGRFDINDVGFQLSRNFKALKIWMSFKAYGAERLRKSIEHDIENAHFLAQLMRDAEDFELAIEPGLSIVCFKFLGNEKTKHSDQNFIDQLNRDIIPALELDQRVFITGTTLHERPVIRACFINHRITKQSIERLVQVIREVGSELVD